MSGPIPAVEQPPICPQSSITPLIEIADVPAHCNVLWPTRNGALNAPRGNIRLVYLPDCGHIYNLDFDPALMEYSQAYENSLYFSPHFQQYATRLAAELIARYNLRRKEIIDIGSGKGDFLKLLCRMGGNRGTGFDPSYVPDAEDNSLPVTFVRQFYTERHAGYEADFICCRHVLEHIERPDAFLTMVRRAIGGRNDTVVFFEVPNALFTLRELGIWDIIYEHYSYFTPHSLTHAFRRNGFQVLNVEARFGGQFLTIEALPADQDQPIESPPPKPETLAQLTQEAATFKERYLQKMGAWQRQLQHIVAGGEKAVVWGSGSKGVTLMNVLKTKDIIQYAIDINPRKQGMHVAGTGQRIVSPDFLKNYRPDVVIIMNANYRDEIERTLQELGVTAEFLLA